MFLPLSQPASLTLRWRSSLLRALDFCYSQCSNYPRYNPDIVPILRLQHLAAMIWHIQTDIAFFIQNR